MLACLVTQEGETTSGSKGGPGSSLPISNTNEQRKLQDRAGWAYVSKVSVCRLRQ